MRGQPEEKRPMFSKYLLLASLVGCAASAHATDPFEKEAIEATWLEPLSDADTPVGPLGADPTDMDPDLAFGYNGARYYSPDPAAPTESWGIRMFARPGNAGWYVLGRDRTGSNPWYAVVVVIDPSGNAERTIVVPTPMFRLEDATYDSANSRFYFAGGARQSGHADSDFAVTCVDIDNGPDGGPCSGFGNSGTAFIAFDRGGNKDDVARRVISRPNLGVLVAGWARDGADRYVFAATSLLRASGGLVTRFGTNGRFTTDLNSNRDNLDVNVFDIALSNDSGSTARLFIAGNYSRDVARRDYDGVVLGLNAWNGVLDSWGPGGAGFIQVMLDHGDPAVDMSDAVTAMAVQANGKLALAGWTKNEDNKYQIMMARLTAAGRFDTSPGFCNSQPCLPIIYDDYWPTSIAEDPMTRDLYVAGELYLSGGMNRTVIWGFRALNGRRRGHTYFDSPTETGETRVPGPASIPITPGATRLLGTRAWRMSASDYDIRVTRLLHNDTIFADMFGGAKGD
jgi:hypothetical protein